ncbi:MAG: PKD domain-containing protein [Halobacteria archaeon]
MKRKLITLTALAVFSSMIFLGMTGSVSAASSGVSCHVHSTNVEVGDPVTIEAHPSGYPKDITVKFELDQDKGPISPDIKKAPGTKSVSFEVTYDSPGDKQPSIAAIPQTDILGPAGEKSEDTCKTIHINKKENLNAKFTYSPNNPRPGEKVNFDASSSKGDIQSYDWDFPGGSKHGESVDYTFNQGGHQQVTLTVEGPQGDTDSDTKTIRLKFNARCSVNNHRISSGDSVTIDASNSQGANKYRYSKYGDGSYTSWTLNSRETFTYDDPDRKSFSPKVQITGSDGEGKDTAECGNIRVHEQAPKSEFQIRPNDNPNVGEKITIDARDSKAGGNNRIIKYQFDVDGDRGFEYSNRDGVLQYTYNSAGRRIVRVRVTDNIGQSDTNSQQVNVEGHPISASFTYSPNNPEAGDTVEFKSTSSTKVGSIINYRWKVNGVTESNSRSFTHTFHNPGREKVELRVKSNKGSSDETTNFVTVTKPKGKKLSSDVRQKPDSPNPDQDVKLWVTGNPSTVSWDFDNDGQYDQVGNPINTSFSNAGTQTVGVKINSGGVDTTETVQVQVNAVSIMEAIDQNGNHMINQQEKTTAVTYWEDNQPVPGTNGQKISDDQIIEIINDYRNGNRINY